jgi:hypothetical protein
MGFARRIGNDLLNTAEAFPTGLKQTLEAAYAANPIDPTHFGHMNLHPAGNLIKQMAIQTAHDVRHPLRHPGLFALDAAAIASLGLGSGFRLAAAGRAATEAGKVWSASQ